MEKKIITVFQNIGKIQIVELLLVFSSNVQYRFRIFFNTVLYLHFQFVTLSIIILFVAARLVIQVIHRLDAINSFLKHQDQLKIHVYHLLVDQTQTAEWLTLDQLVLACLIIMEHHQIVVQSVQ